MSGTHGEYMYLYGGYGPDGYHLHDFFRYNFCASLSDLLEVLALFGSDLSVICIT